MEKDDEKKALAELDTSERRIALHVVSIPSRVVKRP
jgi:hypothetical protein